MNPIAIVGVSCRLPGAANRRAFWRLLTEGREAISEVPEDRFTVEPPAPGEPVTPGELVSKLGGFLEAIDRFDASFFGISPREAHRMDPQQRMLLEVAWEALEDGGQLPDAIAGTSTGVFVGLTGADYQDLQLFRRDPALIDFHAVTGGTRSVASGRISYALDLRGPAISVDTACSSSLTALHIACQSLLSGQCDRALVGGVNLVLQKEPSIGFSASSMLAPDGRCKFGDASASGFVRSDGVGVVVLKPLDRAIADGDTIYAVIRGTALNNDGHRTGSLGTPGIEGQAAVLRLAYRAAGVAPSRVRYVEAHGTGTKAGDPVELTALGEVLGEGRPSDRPLLVGSAKTNVGHTEGAAGIVGLIKAALCLHHREIPPSLHFKTPNPEIPWSKLPVSVVTERTALTPDPEPPCVGVSAFGLSGTNAHAVLEMYTSEPVSNSRKEQASRPRLFTLSAQSPAALAELAASLRELLASEDGERLRLEDVAFTLATRRVHHAHRASLVARSREELIEGLDALARGETLRGLSVGRVDPERARRLGAEGATDAKSKIVFVFPGQGAHWFGMVRVLLAAEPVFREQIERCEAAFRPYCDWSLLHQLESDSTSQTELDRLDVIQPVTFATQVALAALWRSWGVEPDMVIGNSMGEVAAACVSGALSLEDAARVICVRSKLARRTSGRGAMASIGLSAAEVTAHLSAYGDRISIAVNQSPTSTVVSGDREAVEAIVAELEKRDVFARLVRVDFASHSAQMDPLRDDLARLLADLAPKATTTPMFSTVTASLVGGAPLDAAYWWRNLREPVLFAQAVDRLREDGHAIFIELSTHPLMLVAIQQCFESAKAPVLALPSLRREEDDLEVMLASLGALRTAGHVEDFKKPEVPGKTIALASYPFQRERFWRDDPPTTGAPGAGAKGGHPVLGRSLRLAAIEDTWIWQADISAERFPYLRDHRVQGDIVLPAASYLEMALAAGAEVLGEGVVLEGVAFRQAFALEEPARSRALQLIVRRRPDGQLGFQFFGIDGEGAGGQAVTLHAEGVMRAFAIVTPSAPIGAFDACTDTVSKDAHYEALLARGLEFGPSFRRLSEVKRLPGQALGRLRDSERTHASGYQIHPGLLDACFQLIAHAIVDGAGAKDTFLPISVERLWLSPRATVASLGYARFRPRQGAGNGPLVVQGDLCLIDDRGEVILEAQGLAAQRLAGAAISRSRLAEVLYEVQWVETAREEAPAHGAGVWLVLADRSGMGDALAHALSARGDACFVVYAGDRRQTLSPGSAQIDPTSAADVQWALAEARGREDGPLRGVIHMFGLDAARESLEASAEAAQILGTGSALLVTQTLSAQADAGGESPRLWLVTRGVQPVGLPPSVKDVSASVAQAPLWGLGKVIADEQPRLRCTVVDLGASIDEELRELALELSADARDNQIVLRGNARYAARLARCAKHARHRANGDNEALRVELGTPGILGSLALKPCEHNRPGPGQVEVEIHASALNFNDVLKAMNMLPKGQQVGEPFGFEGAGVIRAVGEGVRGLRVGDEVVAVGAGMLTDRVITNLSNVALKPAGITMDQAATLPVAFLTAHYGLCRLGKLRKGEKVLIHLASGGVGIAAVQIAQNIGAEIYATAGSHEKREFVRKLGVKHVFDSRSLDFADEIRAATNGYGVDVVLNSLTGDALRLSMALLAPHGRFIEIGKKDIYEGTEVSLLPFRGGCSYFAVDFLRLRDERPKIIASTLRILMDQIARGKLKPIVATVFPADEAASAFRLMAQGKHIGKVLVDFTSLRGMQTTEATFRPDRSYLITGGLSGLGLATARWMAERGAAHLALVGRRQPSPEAQKAIDELRAHGVSIHTASVDVGDRGAVAALLAEIERTMPPLRGIVHSAGLLDDGILGELDLARLRKTARPKVLGALHLHELTREVPLDFFVMYSSGTSVISSPGQGNYAASNAFLDALAHHRKSLGLPALSINWGPWTEIGLATKVGRGDRFEARGFRGMSPAENLNVLGVLMASSRTQVFVADADWQKWTQTSLGSADVPLLSQLLNDEESSRDGRQDKPRFDRIALLAEAPERRVEIVSSYVLGLLQGVIGLSASRASKLDPSEPLNRLGLDSLMAVELKNLIERHMGVSVPVVRFLRDASLSRIAAAVTEQIEAAAPRITAVLPAAPSTASDVSSAAQLIENVDALSDEEVDALLEMEKSGERLVPVDESEKSGERVVPVEAAIATRRAS